MGNILWPIYAARACACRVKRKGRGFPRAQEAPFEKGETPEITPRNKIADLARDDGTTADNRPTDPV